MRSSLANMQPLLVLVAILFLSLVPSSNAAQKLNPSEGSCTGCTTEGHFCGIDNQCHPYSCQNFYQYADRKLTGYADDTTFQCFGYALGDQENAHGVIYGCDPLFPFTLMTPGKQVTEAFNRKCTAEREGGFKFECYEFQPSETATDFTFFEQKAESSFPDCEGGKQPQYYYMIGSTNRYVGFEGLLGNPIVVAGAEDDGATIWQDNPGSTFKREIAMQSMYANVVGGPGPASTAKPIEAGSMGNNPLRNPGNGNGGNRGNNSGAVTATTTLLSLLVGVGTLLQFL